jgi:FtsH-binding integral membrane protein
MSNDYGYERAYVPVGELSTDARAAFITRTYNHLMGSIVLFTLIEFWLFMTGAAESIAVFVQGSPLIVFGGFVLVGWLASRAAASAVSPASQYMALGGFIVAEAIIFVPILYLANSVAPGMITSAALVTLAGFGGLTWVAFSTRKDFSFLGGLVRWGFMLAIVMIVAALIFGFELGTFFSVAMVGLAGAAILYDTSNVLHHYPEDRHVAAALQLFASVAVMFFYILRIFLGSRD